MWKTNSSQRTLILHAGACKTGTTSLQMYLDTNREGLRRRGILYPATGISETRDLKHQWLVSALLNEDSRELSRRIAEVEAECDSTIHTIILSTEGIFNHWWDYSDTSKALLSALKDRYKLYCWLWLREPVAFLKSYYIQAMRNPQIESVSAYGRAVDLCDFIKMSWVVMHLDYKALKTELENIFGKDQTFIFSYTQNIVHQVCELLRIPDLLKQALDERHRITTLNEAGLSLLKLLNKYHLSAKEKEDACESIMNINAILAPYARALELTVEDANNIMSLCSLSMAELAEINQSSLSRWAKQF